jgi:hypothetical protein
MTPSPTTAEPLLLASPKITCEHFATNAREAAHVGAATPSHMPRCLDGNGRRRPQLERINQNDARAMPVLASRWRALTWVKANGRCGMTPSGLMQLEQKAPEIRGAGRWPIGLLRYRPEMRCPIDGLPAFLVRFRSFPSFRWPESRVRATDASVRLVRKIIRQGNGSRLAVSSREARRFRARRSGGAR